MCKTFTRPPFHLLCPRPIAHFLSIFPKHCVNSFPCIIFFHLHNNMMQVLLSHAIESKSQSVSHFSCVWLFATPWTVVAHQAPLSMEFSRQEYWSGLPFFSRGSSQPRGRTWVSLIAGRFFTIWASRETQKLIPCWFHHLQILPFHRLSFYFVYGFLWSVKAFKFN